MNTGLYNMGSLFRPKMPALPPVQPAPPPPEAELSAEEKERIAKEQAAIQMPRFRQLRSWTMKNCLGFRREFVN